MVVESVLALNKVELLCSKISGATFFAMPVTMIQTLQHVAVRVLASRV